MFITVLRDVLWAEHRDAQTGRYHHVPPILRTAGAKYFFCCFSLLRTRRMCTWEEPLEGPGLSWTRLNWTSLMGCKQMALSHTNKSTRMPTCGGDVRSCSLASFPSFRLCKAQICVGRRIRLKLDFVLPWPLTPWLKRGYRWWRWCILLFKRWNVITEGWW